MQCLAALHMHGSILAKDKAEQPAVSNMIWFFGLNIRTYLPDMS